MQIDNKFSAFWMDTTTAPGTPLTSLSATITIREADSPYTVVVNNEAMTNMGGGHYIYVFAGMSLTKEYVYICNPNATAYIESGVTQNNLYQWIQDNRSGGGGGGFNISPFTNGLNSLRKTITEESTAIKEHITKENSDTNSHLELVKTDISDKIDSIEIPEAILEEKEAKKALKIVTSIDKKLTSYIDSEMKEKEDITQISSEFLKLEKDERERELEEERKKKLQEEEDKKKDEEEKRLEAEQDAKLLEELKAEFDKMEEEDKLEKKKELEEEIKELEKEMKEKEKELKTL